MRYLLIQSLLVALALPAQGTSEAVWTDGDRKLESKQAALWAGQLAKAQNYEPNSKCDALWLGLRNMGHRTTFPGHSAAIDQIYAAIQRNLLATPGHAQHFADLIEAERAALKPGEGNTYDLHRHRYLRETLAHLPSPETVKVLGHYLDDDRDTPPPERLDDSGPMPANSIVAMESLLCLGMREAPYPPGYYLSNQQPNPILAAVRAWFAPIKSGEKPFSFKGQAVEYRFKPDGTWVSTPIANPPDDAPKPPPPRPPKSPTAPAAASPAASPAAPTAAGQAPVWPWLLGVALLVLPAAAWFLKARRRQ